MNKAQWDVQQLTEELLEKIRPALEKFVSAQAKGGLDGPFDPQSTETLFKSLLMQIGLAALAIVIVSFAAGYYYRQYKRIIRERARDVAASMAAVCLTVVVIVARLIVGTLPKGKNRLQLFCRLVKRTYRELKK